jgi:hypothetical protein
MLAVIRCKGTIHAGSVCFGYKTWTAALHTVLQAAFIKITNEVVIFWNGSKIPKLHSQRS